MMRKGILTGSLVAVTVFVLAGCGGDSLPETMAKLEKKDAKDLTHATRSMLNGKGSREILEYFGDVNFSKLSVALGKMEDSSSEDNIWGNYVDLPLEGKHLPDSDDGSGYWTVKYSKGKATDALKNKGDITNTITKKNYICCEGKWKENGTYSTTIKWNADDKKYSFEKSVHGDDFTSEKGDYKITANWKYNKKFKEEKKDGKKTSVKEKYSSIDTVLTKKDTKDTKLAEIKNLEIYDKKSKDSSGKSYEKKISGAIFGKRYDGRIVIKTIETVKGSSCDLTGEIQIKGKDNTVSYVLKDKKYTIKFNDEFVESGSQCGGEAAE